MRFEFKPFDEMTPADYESIGLKAGLEIHQQLLTEKKLFCRCPAGHYSKTYDAEILRHMRPTLSELGEYDGTALMEFKTKKEIIYRIHSDTVCTYEMDDTPPFMMDEASLDIALKVAILLNLNLVNELHIARKQYLDGSIPTGFQRTTILGVDGWIPFKGRRIRIAQLGLEEDACREVSDIGHQRVFLTDRLGMPLIETVTYPDMKTPQEAAEVGEILRRLVRATGNVRTGHGAAREDVNVSIDGGTRVEIKGVPSLSRIPMLIYNEAMRQWNLLRIRELLKQRGITPSTFASGSEDVTRIVSKTQYAPIQQAIDRGEEIHCVRLDNFAGILNEKTQTDTTFAKEISDRVRVVACLTRLPNIVHSDAASETLSAKFWKLIRQRVQANPNDALVLVWGNKEDAECGCNEIAIRAREATEGIPNETRQALNDGTNGFERILPGPDRMYPDTDLPPLALTSDRVERARANLPDPPWKREKQYRKLNLPDDVIRMLSYSPRALLFDRLVDELEVNPMLAGVTLYQHAKALDREGLSLENLSDEEFISLFKAHRSGRLAREGIVEVVRHLITRNEYDTARNGGAPNDPDESIRSALDELGINPVPDDDLRKMVENAVHRTDFPRTVNTRDKKHRYLMGILMERLRGCVEGQIVSGILNEELDALDEVQERKARRKAK
ncbi:MAG: Glu-tRNA(Gln) amidotransferase subunit GatE [Candidatus Latescibacteria bacterium]|nr:Glu-tRNA(Gln) amidotransferase subunit GatE [Candidatus Latescibacterota bacterium]NIM66318.1 Glu-tRNA(Gln) amidotransferase subunit GatE [Candidatus Latescibacterota bacterium]NIO02797.1 Glu-tRNA(Gln) amidotransferase subunit GatE [Candidatus Latescibacterota bacterium]NIO29932.1 Glu-tRNA(Gln) amidotransferase subunit GatE [Candidatus Latescibacterota bacterium]NIO57547.1 Glu-tRNA(Gln) amidotransferase subunit GatE [Candidatus Latescibacterota bacterium]